ncbi:MAG: hypothetical protein ASARMPREDX12_007576 [Alectoria sarmentosa]|nr:MAG: hypothetical protein ASARMPRED_003779 [Alectoria sarmentosa]CAD6575779.1 MAG: hypothetical protein ASARMPREDX12_007576 [Alectoria sarmentosa]
MVDVIDKWPTLVKISSDPAEPRINTARVSLTFHRYAEILSKGAWRAIVSNHLFRYRISPSVPFDEDLRTFVKTLAKYPLPKVHSLMGDPGSRTIQGKVPVPEAKLLANDPKSQTVREELPSREPAAPGSSDAELSSAGAAFNRLSLGEGGRYPEHVIPPQPSTQIAKPEFSVPNTRSLPHTLSTVSRPNEPVGTDTTHWPKTSRIAPVNNRWYLRPSLLRYLVAGDVNVTKLEWGIQIGIRMIIGISRMTRGSLSGWKPS